MTISYTVGPYSPGTMADDAAIGTVAWTNADNAKASDAAYASQATALGNVLAGDHIQDNAVRIIKGGTIGTTDRSFTSGPNAVWPASEAYVSHGGAADLWGETWTPADINDAGLGVAVSAYSGDGTTHYLKATNFPIAAIPANATIVGILVEIEKKGNG